MLSLKELSFRKPYGYETTDKPMLGKATFSDNSSEIQIGLTAEQTYQILIICEASIREAIESGIKSMHENLIEATKQPALENKNG